MRRRKESELTYYNWKNHDIITIFQEKRRKCESSGHEGNGTVKPWGKHLHRGFSCHQSYASNKLGVYNLVPIKRSVMIGNGQSISCTHKGKLDVVCKHKDGSIARETWDVKIVPQLNHDLFSFTKAMKERW